MSDIINNVPIVGVVMFLVWVGNQAGIPRKFSPLVATVLGVSFAFFYLYPGNFPEALIQGILIASSAVGFHSGTKNMLQYIHNGKPPDK
ncbi:hypothetical protein [Candidatus Formimonas warabiya]|uniref:Holin n=1 Tax=Formimonas warabiya TaxID=1761012 RepID=A0A3G1L134_FORW1|nr:hypothetical protein [Candidatus Formimonas warabiya]ATW28377.1 hypothetical protein DCMF_05535 [Candidatus Formimonas warabiya]